MVSLKNKPRNCSSGFKTSHTRLNGDDKGGHSSKACLDLKHGHELTAGHEHDLKNGHEIKNAKEAKKEHVIRNGHEPASEHGFNQGHEVPLGIINRHEWRNELLNSQLKGFKEEDTDTLREIGDFGKIGDIGEFSRFSEVGSISELKPDDKGKIK